jgi:hypothetical protein
MRGWWRLPVSPEADQPGSPTLQVSADVRDRFARRIRLADAYLYSTQETPLLGEADGEWPSERRKIIILGGGPNRIGQGIEFDYCCCQPAAA